jgi:hypothetical protein
MAEPSQKLLVREDAPVGEPPALEIVVEGPDQVGEISPK